MSRNSALLPLLTFLLAFSGKHFFQQIEVAATTQAQSQPVKEEQAPIKWPKDWSDYVGKRVTVEGVAVNMKIEAVLYGDGRAIFLDGMASWPDGFYFGNEQGKRLRVTGTVIERHDLPVVLPTKKNELPVQGIVVPEGTNLDKASQRFLIQNAKWIVVE